jgi:twitching motility protein PilJ
MAWFKKKPAPDGQGGSTHIQEGNPTNVDDATTLEMSHPLLHGPTQQLDDPDTYSQQDQFEQQEAQDRTTLSQRIAAQQRLLWLLAVVALIVLLAAVWWVAARDNRATRNLSAASEAQLQSQRLLKAVPQAVTGNPEAFEDLRQSARALTDNMNVLHDGLGADYAGDMSKLAPLASRVANSATVIAAQGKLLISAGTALRAITSQSTALLDSASQVSALKVQQGGSPAEISAAGQLVMLTQRIDKSAHEMLAPGGMDTKAAQSLDHDLTTIQNTAKGLLDGNSGMHLAATRDTEARAKIESLLTPLERIHANVSGALTNPQELNQVQTAQTAIGADSTQLIDGLGRLQTRLSGDDRLGWAGVIALLAPALIVLLVAVGLVAALLRGSRSSQAAADKQRQRAEQQQREASRINDATQAAILRLMNELQAVAEGDLTQEATVTEDVTGAIADSVNYTVEELRALVGNVQNAAARVAETTSGVETTSTELLATSTEQLREIRETGQSVVSMAKRINDVSAHAQESVKVARQSVQAAASGQKAVQDSIGGMNTIRDQIQETSKRIKRLGESSQEIGEITELIADITEQTNVLALNAAIQAASAGEAGRGFSVVAEEVQRLAERSADATRQIAALVKAIQTDTQDAAAAMERSTRGVVDGARLSDNAGAALTEIDRVSHQLAQLIEQISSTTAQEAEKANVVAGNIQHIFAVTEQTGQSTRTSADQVRELARIADELRQSVARFKIA